MQTIETILVCVPITGSREVSRKLYFVSILLLLNGCMSVVSTETYTTSFRFPVHPVADEVVIYVAKGGAYGSDWAYFSLELNGEYKILNADDCNYFVVKGSQFLLRSKRNSAGDPVAKLFRKNLKLGSTYYYLQDGNGKSKDSHFKEVTAQDIIPICAEYGFGRVMNNPPNTKWGENELKLVH